jgi:TIR domain
MSDIFISYKREDQQVSRKIATALEQEGWTIWWDPKLRAGEHFDDVIDKALTSAKCVVVLWSEGSLRSQYVRDEATYALEHHKLVPVAIEAVEMPFRFRGIQTLRLLAWDGSRDSSEFRKLCDDIAAIVNNSGEITPDDVHHMEERLSEQERQRSEKDAGRKAKEESPGTPIRPLTGELLRGRPTDRMVGWCGLATLLLGYVATTLGRIYEGKVLGLAGQDQDSLVYIHFGMKFGVGALFIVGYLAITVWVYRRYLHQLEKLKRWLSAAAITACGLLLAGSSIYATLPPALDLLVLLDKETNLWNTRLLKLKAQGGGLKASTVDASAEPQVWSTAQALTGIMVNGRTGLTEMDGKQIREHLEYIEKLALPNEEGWGYFPEMNMGVTEIAGWVALAYLESTEVDMINLVWGNDSEKAFQRLDQYLRLLKSRQLANGGWAPISQKDNEKFGRTYSTTMALWALIEAKKHPDMGKRIGKAYDEAITGGIGWLLTRYKDEVKSWVPNPERPRQTERFAGLTAQVLYVMERARPEFDSLLNDSSYQRALQHFKRSIVGDTDSSVSLVSRPASGNDRIPDGDIYLRPSTFMLEPSTFLWFPWSLALCSQLSARKPVDTEATRSCTLLLGRVGNLISFANNEHSTYVMAESLFAIRLQIKSIIDRQLATPGANR